MSTPQSNKSLHTRWRVVSTLEAGKMFEIRIFNRIIKFRIINQLIQIRAVKISV